MISWKRQSGTTEPYGTPPGIALQDHQLYTTKAVEQPEQTD